MVSQKYWESSQTLLTALSLLSAPHRFPWPGPASRSAVPAAQRCPNPSAAYPRQISSSLMELQKSGLLCSLLKMCNLSLNMISPSTTSLKQKATKTANYMALMHGILFTRTLCTGVQGLKKHKHGLRFLTQYVARTPAKIQP